MIIIVLGLALIVGFMVADAILDWVFIAAYAFLAMATLNSIIHIFKCYRKHNKIDEVDIGQIAMCLVGAVVLMFLQVKIL